MGEVRNCNSEVGSFIFTNGVLKSGKNRKSVEEIVNDFMVNSKGEDRYILSFNRKGIIYFKAIKRTELKNNFNKVMYFNGNTAKGFASKYGSGSIECVVDVYRHQPDVHGETGYVDVLGPSGGGPGGSLIALIGVI